MSFSIPDRPRRHLVHPWEYAMLIHNYDRRHELQQVQLNSIHQVQNIMRRAAPLISEFLDRIPPTIAHFEQTNQPREMLMQIQQDLVDQEQIIRNAYIPTPTPFVPDDDYGFLRRPEQHIPAPMLRKQLFPRSRSAPARLYQPHSRTELRPWLHVHQPRWTLRQAFRIAARSIEETAETTTD